ncbi:MAG: tetratricopeptide repeat protein [Bacteriovoracaceae bacterium]|jgi:Tfp pilus assembly protein PilF|nr:tetratricopeptide repeat protein [Bacteriovoracaceae bacterium]
MKLLLLPFITIIFISCSSNKKSDGLTQEQKKASLYFNQGTRNLVDQKFHQALKNLRLSVKYDPQNSEAHNNLGMAYYYRKSNSMAETHFKKAILLDKNFVDPKQNLATLYMETNRYNDALTIYNQILKNLEYEGQYKTYFNIGTLFLRQKKLSLALKNYKKSIEVNSSFCPSHFKIGMIYKKAKKDHKALEYFANATKGVCYGLFEPLKEKVLTLTRLGLFNQAKVDLQEALERFSKQDQINEIQKLKKYIAIKENKQSF